MPNIWHLAHQTLKSPLMRCSKCYNIWHTWKVSFHLWNDTDKNATKKKLFIFSIFLYDFLSSLSSFFLLSFSTSPFIFCHSLFLFSSSFFSRIFTSPFFFTFFPFFCHFLYASLGAFVLGENDFRKSFSHKPACLTATENEIFRKFISCWPIFTPLTRK